MIEMIIINIIIIRIMITGEGNAFINVKQIQIWMGTNEGRKEGMGFHIAFDIHVCHFSMRLKLGKK